MPSMHASDVPRRERLHAWFGRSGLGLKVIGLAALGTALVITVFVLFDSTEDGTFEREALNAALGAVATVTGAIAIGTVTLWQQIRRSRESAWVRRFETVTDGRTALRVGRMLIPDVLVVASCGQERPWTERVQVEFKPLRTQPRGETAKMLMLRDTLLSELQHEADDTRVSLTDGPCVDIVSASLESVRDVHGRTRHKWLLEPAEASYLDFALTSADLDRKWPGGTQRTLREVLEIQPRSLLDVSGLPTIAKVGVGTAVVTRDGQLVLGVRGRTFVAGRRHSSDGRSPVHLVAEGMLPSDTNREGLLDPKETAHRGLHEELGLGRTSTSLGAVERLAATEFFFDQKRLQPYFAYLATVNIEWDELQTLAKTADSAWENEDLIAFPYDVNDDNIRMLLTGEHPQLGLASNHAAAILWFALLYRHGPFEMRDALAKPR